MEAEKLNPETKIIKPRKINNKIHELDLDALERNKLNLSTSKMQFTFSKSDRF